MPLYSYKCQDCGILFEIRHSHKDNPGGCVECKSSNIEKHLGQPLNRIAKIQKKGSTNGQVVKETIEETFNEIKKDKTRLSKRTYKVKK